MKRVLVVGFLGAAACVLLFFADPGSTRRRAALELEARAETQDEAVLAEEMINPARAPRPEPTVHGEAGTVTTQAGARREARSESGDPDGESAHEAHLESAIRSYLVAQNQLGFYELSIEPTLVYREAMPEDGLHTTHHPGGEKAGEGWMSNGKPVGTWSEWYEDGTRKSEGSYYYGNKQGFWSSWYPSGERESAGEYLYGKQEGPWVEWYDGGGKRREVGYKNGKREDLERTWFENGRIATEGGYRDGEPEGPWTTWYDTGALHSQGSFHYGAREGGWTFWKEDGEIDPEQSGIYERNTKVDG